MATGKKPSASRQKRATTNPRNTPKTRLLEAQKDVSAMEKALKKGQLSGLIVKGLIPHTTAKGRAIRPEHSAPGQLSEAIASISYNNKKEELRITFARNGARYIYQDVPLTTWVAFQASVSWGTFFNHFVRNNFPHEMG